MTLPERPYLAALPIAGTAAAYSFEAGFAHFHGIPNHLIQLNASQFVGTAVFGLFVVWILHAYLALGLALLDRGKWLLLKFVGLGMLGGVTPLLVFLGMGLKAHVVWTVFVLACLAPILLGLIGAWASRDKETSFLDRWWKSSAGIVIPKNAKDESAKNDLARFIETTQSLLVFCILFAGFTYGLGMRYAAMSGSPLVLKSDPSKALVVIYGERWFFRPVDTVRAKSTPANGDLTIMSGDTVKDMVLRPQPP